MERTAPVPRTPVSRPSGLSGPSGPSGPSEKSEGAGIAGIAALLDAMPRQRRAGAPTGSARPAVPRVLRLWRLLPTPLSTPFTFGYGALLALVSLLAERTDPSVVRALQQASSTDVAHLVRTPALVLLASALWIAGGLVSTYTLGFLLVLTALERRIGGARTAVVFLLGHVLATLATEVPVGLAVVVGRLPDSSLHRLDYGISFGVAAATGALAGLLAPWLRWPLLALAGVTLGAALAQYADPMTGWGHLIALCVGVATWPLVRRWRHGLAPAVA